MNVVKNNPRHAERNFSIKVNENGFTPTHFKYNVEDENLRKLFNKAYIGVVENLGAAYFIQDYFNMEGLFHY